MASSVFCEPWCLLQGGDAGAGLPTGGLVVLGRPWSGWAAANSYPPITTADGRSLDAWPSLPALPRSRPPGPPANRREKSSVHYSPTPFLRQAIAFGKSPTEFLGNV